jgi:hypothetical protein
MTSWIGDVPSTRWTTTTLTVWFLTKIASPDPRSWPLRKTRAAPRSETTAMTWPSPPSLRWLLV